MSTELPRRHHGCFTESSRNLRGAFANYLPDAGFTFTRTTLYQTPHTGGCSGVQPKQQKALLYVCHTTAVSPVTCLMHYILYVCIPLVRGGRIEKISQVTPILRIGVYSWAGVDLAFKARCGLMSSHNVDWAYPSPLRKCITLHILSRLS